MKLKALVNDKGALDTWISKNFIDPRNNKVAKQIIAREESIQGGGDYTLPDSMFNMKSKGNSLTNSRITS